ncbi:acetoacetate--CoA ligase [Rhodococcus cercidiphylli]|uniref:Acetoacetate--CoA ligase n=2 Tax=Rhodococcus cercidiphylli TaxID=489916 RepID=A0ABU4AWJ1_9NOCA|nr:acetoacetate--CoA ligase [Rhodococcus cercidiphylli]MDV6230603.1 acetoacetate--CoA ligase [Rhodococcus cercidiphylli]
MIEEPETLWAPSAERRKASRMADFQQWIRRNRQVDTTTYDELWSWSVTDLDSFWMSIWQYFDVVHSSAPTCALAEARMPGAKWFPGARLNWAENLLRHASTAPTAAAVIAVTETGFPTITTWSELEQKSANLASRLRDLGVGPGDRVAAILPNIAESVVALLATASLGAIWSCCSPDFGVKGLVDRFAQVEPKVLIGVDGYVWGGKSVDRSDVVADVRAALPTVEHMITVRHLHPESSLGKDVLDFDALTRGSAAPRYEQLPFEHPLWVLYSSGTTGLPKGIVHSHGGIVLESLKANALAYDLGPEDRVLIAASTAWVVWNMLVDSMFTGCSIVVYDGSPTAGGPDHVLRLCGDHGVTRFGTGAAYLTLCEKAGVEPGRTSDLSRLRSIMTTGSPLPDSTWRWVYDAVSSDVLLGSDSGGTDVATAFVGANPLQEVRTGELMGACLGCRVEAWSEDGTSVVGEVGEMVITAPMPSMPIRFWNDADGHRYRDSYFDTFPGVWRHGDWITISDNGSCQIHGRSDSTINRGGVRMGSADIYDAVEAMPEVAASLVIGAELAGGGYHMPLFVVTNPGFVLDEELIDKINRAIRTEVSPRHVPDVILSAPAVPMTRTGKRLEVPIKKLIQGVAEASAVNRGTVADLDVLQWYVDYAAAFRAREVR